jgi:uncharacterized protein YlxW (UPF0749 family)
MRRTERASGEHFAIPAMLNLPFVSRGRYEDLKAEVSELKMERQQLLDRVEELTRLLAIAEANVNTQRHVPTRATMEQVRSAANRAAMDAAEGRGPSLWRRRGVPSVR